MRFEHGAIQQECQVVAMSDVGAAAAACDQCDADAELTTPFPDVPNITVIAIRHDPWCAELARREGRERTRDERRTARRAGYR